MPPLISPITVLNNKMFENVYLTVSALQAFRNSSELEGSADGMEAIFCPVVLLLHRLWNKLFFAACHFRNQSDTLIHFT